MKDEAIKAAILTLEAEGYTVTPPDSIKFGCHLELCNLLDGKPDPMCVLDEGIPSACVYADKIKFREQCQYWLRITPASIRKYGGKL